MNDTSEATWGEIECVVRGAALLDEKYPRWWQEIDTVALDINSHRTCVLGQVYGSYYSGLEFLELSDAGTGVAVAHGFMPTFDREDTLTGLWVRTIQLRMRMRRHERGIEETPGQGPLTAMRYWTQNKTTTQQRRRTHT